MIFIISFIKKSYLLLGLTSIILASLFIAQISSATDDKVDGSSTMMKLISDNEDTKMTSNDLAFLLATHGFDAVPKKDYVEVHLSDTVYRIVPNGDRPGLANVSIVS